MPQVVAVKKGRSDTLGVKSALDLAGDGRGQGQDRRPNSVHCQRQVRAIDG